MAVATDPINLRYMAFPGISSGGLTQSGFGREPALETLDLCIEAKGVGTSSGARSTNPFGL